MKYSSLLMLTVVAAGVHACNPVYEMCMKTAQSAVDACKTGGYDSIPSCACSAEKQVLACFSECPQNEQIFDQEEKQMTRISDICGRSGAEAEDVEQKDHDGRQQENSGAEQQVTIGEQEEEEEEEEILQPAQKDNKKQQKEDEKKDQTVHAASIPEPIHKDAGNIFGQTHAKPNQDTVNQQQQQSMGHPSESSASAISAAMALIGAVFPVAVVSLMLQQ
ncbi:hypothetical protein BDB00DRAFT_143003 [Zychaea mexicana]|uniref:uncharacterized protein n=1 Tax=Zychaea mexicana TaxID=64656 RepID=UPI0022FE80FE|nr:uncharacterized protein BDB00DRAFT_143003 [Zychaea mexicana]KAI9496323.1 hypothetical protein BDB00DRAFT_143003 [Zychaea mexicana]